MPLPTPRDVHINAPLTNISVAYIQQQSAFIADRVFPIVRVNKQSDLFFRYSKADWHRDEAQERAPATESAGGGWRMDTDDYFARVYAYHKDVDDQTRANADMPIDMDRDATEFVTQKLLLRREKVWANTYFQSGIWGIDLVGVAAAPAAGQFLQWDQANSTPIEDVTTQAIAIAEQTGFRPNRLVLTPYVYNTLRHHPEVLDRIKYTQRGVVTTEILAALFDVEQVVIPWGIENTQAEGLPEEEQFVFGKHAMLVYANPRPSILQPSAGYIFAWTGLLGAGAYGNRIRRFRMELLAADRVEGEMAFVPKLVAADCGAFFANAVA